MAQQREQQYVQVQYEPQYTRLHQGPKVAGNLCQPQLYYIN